VALLLKMAIKPDALNIRMKVLSPLQGLPINESQQTLLTNLASNPDLANTSTRQFALSLLASRNTQANHPNPILWQSASNDPDATVRATAIEHIRNHPVPPSPSRVVPILDSDPDWNVRYAAVETLARIPSEDEAHNALNALKNTARNDPHPEVAGRARSILNGDI
jgi:HEAT repeat protein